MLSEFDKQLLNQIQGNIPFDKRPFAAVAERLGSDEDTVISRLRDLKERGFIRRIGPFFDSGRLGYVSTLVALEVAAEAVAFADVEDNLAAQQLLAAQHAQETAALEAARKQLEIAMNRYRAGLVTYLEVATAQNTALQQERTVVRLRGERLVTVVALVKSLGGGW